MSTYKQNMLILSKTGVKVYDRVNLSVDEASGYISRILNGEVDMVRQELVSRGGEIVSKPKVNKDWQKVYDKAHNSGMEAARNCVPTPMVVSSHSNPLDDSSPVVESYYVPQGPCGFAQINFKGNTGFARWAKKENLCDKSYSGGYYIWVGGQLEEFSGTQSMEIKEAYARAFAKVLNENGVKAYSSSRLD